MVGVAKHVLPVSPALSSLPSLPPILPLSQLDRLFWGSLHATSLPTSTSVGAAFDGASQHMRFELSHATALSLPFLDKEGEWGFLDGLPVRMTLSPLLARRPINLRYVRKDGGRKGMEKNEQ